MWVDCLFVVFVWLRGILLGAPVAFTHAETVGAARVAFGPLPLGAGHPGFYLGGLTAYPACGPGRAVSGVVSAALRFHW